MHSYLKIYFAFYLHIHESRLHFHYEIFSIQSTSPLVMAFAFSGLFHTKHLSSIFGICIFRSFPYKVPLLYKRTLVDVKLILLSFQTRRERELAMGISSLHCFLLSVYLFFSVLPSLTFASKQASNAYDFYIHLFLCRTETIFFLKLLLNVKILVTSSISFTRVFLLCLLI